MTKLPKIEKCVCGSEAMFGLATARVRCKFMDCWMGSCGGTKREQIKRWNAVMKAAKAAELAKRAARRNAQAKAAKKERAK